MSARTTVLAVAVLACAVMSTGRAEPQARASPSFDEIYKAYASGNVQVVVGTLSTLESLQAIRSDLFDVMKRWRPGDWDPVTAMFLFEVSVTGFHAGWPDAPFLLDRARAIVQERPDAPGKNARDDAFEITFHKAAVALLIGLLRSDAAERYLKEIEPRVAAAPSPGKLSEPRLTLAHGVVLELRSRPGLSPVFNATDRGMRPPPGETKAIELAIQRFDLAVRQPATFAEASIRKSQLLYRLNKFEEAVSVLARADADTSDPYIAYWCWLFRGRALDSLGRSGEAEAAYRRAAAIVPDAQSPAVALAALLIRLNRSEEAQDWAARARLARTDAVDPWWRYWSGDLRFLPEWVDELRKAGR